MNASPSLSLRALLFASVVLLTASALAQAPPKYDPATETTLKAVVGELKFIPAGGAKPNAYLITRAGPDKDKGTVEIFLCPKKFLDDIGITFKADESIQVTGSKVKQDGADLILAREVVRDGGSGETLSFRFPDGKPAW